MKNDYWNGHEFGLLEGLFEYLFADLIVASVYLVEQFHFLAAESRDTAFTSQEFGELGGELLKGPSLAAVRLVKVNATLRLLLLELLVPLLE